MCTRGIVSVCVGLALIGAAASASAAPAFVGTPTAAVEGEAVRIAFQVNEVTDCEVAILDAQGAVVRHLAAGLLGERAPAPLVKGSLKQGLLWDGKDNAGRRVGTGTYTVRVRLTLGAEFGRLVDWEEPSLATRGVLAFDVDQQGNIYGLNASMWEGRGGGQQLMVWDREGRYLRQIMPFRRDVDLKRLPGVTLAELDTGQKVPNGVYFPQVLGARFIMLARDDRVTLFGVPQAADRRHHLVRVMADDGAAPPEGWLGPALPGQFGKRLPGYLAASPDGKTFYVSGMGDAAGKVMNVVCRARWDEKEAATFIGPEAKLSDPRGLATDAQGRLYVCDFNHDRIAVFDPDGKPVRDLPVIGPEQVKVDPKTGAVYVYSLRDGIKRETGKSLMYEDKSIVKFSGLDDWNEVARIDLPKRARHMHDAGPIMTLDTSGKEPAILVSYVGRQVEGDHLWKIADRGTTLARLEPPVGRHYWPFVRSYTAIAIDRDRDEVYLAGRSFDKVYRMDGRTGELTALKAITADIHGRATLPVNHPQVTGLAVDREGRLYVRLMGTWSSQQNWIRRYDRQGRRVPFTKAAKAEPEARILGDSGVSAEGDLIVTQPSRGYHSGGLAVAPNGDLYVIEKAIDPATQRQVRGNANVLNIYSPEGALKHCAIPWLSAGAWGPRLDAQGNLYLTDAIKPKDATSMFTGSLVRYGPEGGRVKMDVKDAPYVTRRDERDLPTVELQGAHWVYYGVGLIPFGHCVCDASQFDLDAFGRSVVPDANRHRVKVVDAGGNFLFSFGEYGNRDSGGPMSSVPVPDIPLFEPNTIAVSDRAVYVYDRRNHRILCVNLTHAAEAEVKVTLK